MELLVTSSQSGWLSHYKVVFKYEVGIPVLKGAGDNVLPTRGMVDLECKIGKIKVIMRKVVICALDLNVLSSYSLHEQGLETRLGTLKVSGLYHKKVKFPLKISDRAWWLEVLVLKHQGNSSCRKGNGPQDMEIDHVGTVQPCLSSKARQTKAVVTEVNSEHKKPMETLEGKREQSPRLSGSLVPLPPRLSGHCSWLYLTNSLKAPPSVIFLFRGFLFGF